MNELSYRGMSLTDGVKFVKSHFSTSDLEVRTSFSELHELRDANMTLPFTSDCGQDKWLQFANAVIDATDKNLKHNAR